MSHLEVIRQQEAMAYAPDVLACADGRVRETAKRCGVTINVALRVLVPFHIYRRGYTINETALLLGVSRRTVERHLKRERQKLVAA